MTTDRAINYLCTPCTATATILLVAGACALLAGAGYGRLALRIGAAAIFAAATGVAVWFITFMAFALAIAPTERSDIAATFYGVLAGIGAGTVLLVVLVARLWKRRARYGKRRPPSRSMTVLGLAACALGIFVAVRQVPAVNPSSVLARQVVYDLDFRGGSAAAHQLRRRGDAALPAIIGALAEARADLTSDPDAVRPDGIANAFYLLRELGTADATTELQRWTRPGIPPDLQQAAKNMLAE